MLYRKEIGDFTGIDPSSFVYSSMEALTLIVIVMSGYWLIKSSIVKIIKVLVDRSKNEMIRTLSRNRVLRNFTLTLPFFLLFSCNNLILNKIVSNIYEKSIYSILVLVVMVFFFSVINVLTETYSRNIRIVERFPVKPMFQIIKVFAFVVAMIVISANLMNQTPIYILSGLGAISAVIMFIFKDSLQSLVAAFQITLHKSVKPGDWIEVPKHQVDGSVIDINLSVMSIRNWDNTTTVIPTSCLLTESFKNWTTMHRDGRRIKRHISLDVASVRRLTSHDMDRLKKVKILTKYLEQKESEISCVDNLGDNADLFGVNSRSLTNVGTFRKYVEFYLRGHDDVRKDQLLVVRQLPSQSIGLPIELYCFTSKTSLAEYEDIQSDIFDHLYSIVDLFDLRVFQSPSGSDLSALRGVR